MPLRELVLKHRMRILAGLLSCAVLIGGATWWSWRLNSHEQQLLGVWEQNLGEDGFKFTEFTADRQVLSEWSGDPGDITRGDWRVRNGQLYVSRGDLDVRKKLFHIFHGTSSDDRFPIIELTPQRLVVALGQSSDSPKGTLTLLRSTRRSLADGTIENQ